MDSRGEAIIDVLKLSKTVFDEYLNVSLCDVDEFVVRMSFMTQPFYWHLHPNADELFYVIEGPVLIDLEKETIELSSGQMFKVPKNVKHRTRPKGRRSINLTFEKRNMQTVKCEDPTNNS